ncbi:MAG: methyltransferase domain-containing protein [Acidimicrobiia bacterium]|nr:methyltransferase domain-containing protein [Acidimicrobiia bacterium]
MNDPVRGGVESWSGDRATRWVRQAAGIERQLAPVSDRLLAAAAIAPGESVLDIGCGTGPTTREAARAAGAGGRVTGLDLSEDMLAAAAGVATEPGSAPIDWLQADGSAWSPPEPAAYDVVISRFGVMFFSDPLAAFTNFARVTKPGGRLATAVWARRGESEVFEVPLQAALRALDQCGAPYEPPADDDGPYSFHDPASVEQLLTAAGWSSVEQTTHDLTLLFAGGASPQDAAPASLDFGPTRIVAEGADDETKAAIVAEIAEAFATRVDTDGHVALGGRIRVVQARIPDA